MNDAKGLRHIHCQSKLFLADPQARVRASADGEVVLCDGLVDHVGIHHGILRQGLNDTVVTWQRMPPQVSQASVHWGGDGA